MIAKHQRKGTYLDTRKFSERTQGTTYTQEIHCWIEKINYSTGVIQSYRSMQLENMVFRPIFEIEKEMFEPMNEDDLYRAGLTQKIGYSEAYNRYETGEYYAYT